MRTFKYIFSLILAFVIFLSVSAVSYAAEARIIGRFTNSSSIYSSCTDSRYYSGQNCGGNFCSGAPNFTITWTQSGNSRSPQSTSSTCRGDLNAPPPAYAFCNCSGLNNAADAGANGDPVTISINTGDPDFPVNYWDRGTSRSVGSNSSNCDNKPNENGYFLTTSSVQNFTINKIYGGNGGCDNHLWFYYLPISLSASITPTSASGTAGSSIGPFTATANGEYLTQVSIYYALSTADFSQGSSWTRVAVNSSCNGARSCNASDSFTPTQAGTYYVVVNAIDTKSTPQTTDDQLCSGNPSLPSGWINCGSTRATVTVVAPTATPTPTRTPTPTPSLTPTPIPPTLGTLNIVPDTSTGAVSAGTYGVSGLRSTESGSNYYNALQITQNVANGSNAALVGTAFVSKTSLPANNTLSELMRSSNYNNTENGFVLLYANSNTTYSGGPTANSSGNTGTSGCSGYNFCQGKYYVYFKGQWGIPLVAGNTYTGLIRSNNAVGVTIPRTGSNPPSAPRFSVTLYKAIGNHTWGTYGYVMNNSSNVETAQAINPPTPTPTPTFTPTPTPRGARIM